MRTFTSHRGREDVEDILVQANDLVPGESLRIEIKWRPPAGDPDAPDMVPAELLLDALRNDLHEAEFSRDVVTPHEVLITRTSSRQDRLN